MLRVVGGFRRIHGAHPRRGMEFSEPGVDGFPQPAGRVRGIVWGRRPMRQNLHVPRNLHRVAFVVHLLFHNPPVLDEHDHALIPT